MPKETRKLEVSYTPKFIFVSGGVLSSLGKGIVTASIALLLKSRGIRVTVVKCENYLNIDAGLINPIEHGDPFLCEDGAETDMDLGTYEKFLGQHMGKHNFVTMGQIYKSVIDKERAFGYNGEDVEVPHVCEEIITRLMEAGRHDKAGVVIVELGGTAGEYLNVLFYEAARILRFRNKQRVVHVHVGYLPTPAHIGEPKTKPTQLSVKTLNSLGIQPEFIVARSPKRMDDRRRERFSLFCNVESDHIIDSPDVENVYEIPLIFRDQHFDELLLDELKMPYGKLDLKAWETLVTKSKKTPEFTARIAIIGKYLKTGEYQLKDSYAALIDALTHAGLAKSTKLEIVWIQAEEIERLQKNQGNLSNQNLANFFGHLDGMIVPIGWGSRGVEGKIRSIQYAREQKIPYLGLCYGMQLAMVEFARNVLGWEDANTQEVDPKSKKQVIHMIPAQKRILENRAYGGTMRLGSWECIVKPDTIVYNAYKKYQQFTNPDLNMSAERHRHRYECNDELMPELESHGVVVSGRSVKENLVELVELPKSMHPFFVGTQGHPEYKSTPLVPHAFFLAFIEAARTKI